MRPWWVALLVLTSGCLGSGSGPNADDAPPDAERTPADEATPDAAPGHPGGDAKPTTTPTQGPRGEFPKIEDDSSANYIPHVIVGIHDSGINPYHPVYYRPDLTAHPCTYIQGMPCMLKALNLSVGIDDWGAAYEADATIWQSIRIGEWYWIPRTNIVAVSCNEMIDVDSRDGDLPEEGTVCILDETESHGTGTTSSVLSENPNALLAFIEGHHESPLADSFDAAGIPIDVRSVSWGNMVPMPVPEGVDPLGINWPSIHVVAAGNDPRPAPSDRMPGQPEVISVGGAYADSKTDHESAARMTDVVSWYCRPVAMGFRGFLRGAGGNESRDCGTSFAAPTVAGALSRVILELRTTSGYTGNISGEFVDPILGVTVKDLRDAMNVTASFDPPARYSSQWSLPGGIPMDEGIPLNPVAPWLQWGWGFYDGWVANQTIDLLLKGKDIPPKPDDCVTYMEAIYAFRQAYYG